mgnify:CR=1 FL=1
MKAVDTDHVWIVMQLSEMSRAPLGHLLHYLEEESTRTFAGRAKRPTRLHGLVNGKAAQIQAEVRKCTSLGYWE